MNEPRVPIAPTYLVRAANLLYEYGRILNGEVAEPPGPSYLAKLRDDADHLIKAMLERVAAWEKGERLVEPQTGKCPLSLYNARQAVTVLKQFRHVLEEEWASIRGLTDVSRRGVLKTIQEVLYELERATALPVNEAPLGTTKGLRFELEETEPPKDVDPNASWVQELRRIRGILYRPVLEGRSSPGTLGAAIGVAHEALRQMETRFYGARDRHDERSTDR